MESFAPYLDIAIKAARAAGDLLRADFHRSTGPRGEKDKSPVDTEAEQVIRGILLGAESEWGFLGEETGIVPGRRKAPVWVVDPNDGTRDFIKGRRGSSVSIALVANRQPVLGVVHPFNYPDDDGVMYSAAVGREGVWKNGAPVGSRLVETLSELDVVLVSGGGDRAARSNLICTKPGRVMSIPSIAHRMALVAAGEAAATTSLYTPNTWDFAAGHYLILAAGGAAVDQNGKDPLYDDEGDGSALRLFVGSRSVALELAKRNWDLAFKSERETAMPIARLRKGGATSDPSRLRRAQGALLGQLTGSALGALFAGVSPAGRDHFSSGAMMRAGLGKRLAPGQMGSSGEVAVAVARSLFDLASDAKSLRKVYAEWADSSPTEPDRAYEALSKGSLLSDNLSALSLARVAPLTIWGQEADPMILTEKVRADTALTHPSPVAGEATSVLAIVIKAMLHQKEALVAVEDAHAFARRSKMSREVIEAVAQSAVSPGPITGSHAAPDARAALQFALFQLAHAPTFGAAIEEALDAASTSEALVSIVGAVAGARFGRGGIPSKLRQMVLSCRPIEGLVATPRPSIYWATDAMALAEGLLTSR